MTRRRTREAGQSRRKSRGQSEVLGVVLLLGITIMGTGLVVAFGSSALDGSKQASEIDSAEHAMTQFDSHAAMVALGDSAVQSVSFGQSGGDYSVRPDAGTIEITHVDYDGDETESDDNDHTILDETSLGAVVYENGETTIAYQGGGVWRKGENGAARMVSPPEFHYQGSTLTLPIIHVKGSGGAAGSPTGRITEITRAERVYPLNDPSDTYGAPSPYKNPLESGKMVATIQSEYYEAWADYFRTRTSGTVEVDHSTDPGTVTVNLVSTGTTGNFNMPSDGSGVNIRGIEGGHSLSDYTITLQPDDTDSADFKNLQWSMYAENGDQQFELHLRHQNGNDCDSGRISATVYYSEDGGDTYHGWYDDDAYTTECFDADGDDDEDEVRLVANFVDGSEGPELTYQSLSQSELTHFSLSGATLESSATFDEHEENVGWEPQTYSEDGGGDTETTESIDRLMKHYLALMGPGFDLKVDDKNSDTVNEDVSSGSIHYCCSDKFVTYLHITENEVKVEFN